MKEEGKRANAHLTLEPVGSSSFPPMEKILQMQMHLNFHCLRRNDLIS